VLHPDRWASEELLHSWWSDWFSLNVMGRDEESSSKRNQSAKRPGAGVLFCTTIEECALLQNFTHILTS